jgi:hypothetical protein
MCASSLPWEREQEVPQLVRADRLGYASLLAVPGEDLAYAAGRWRVFSEQRNFALAPVFARSVVTGRTRALNDQLTRDFNRWYPNFHPGTECRGELSP